eukprot:TRINITY_DN8897_c0_g1_i1.p1 TRINITY_DN8897_c0_g1~~TRINITY_DN8897_c0_g1_i1.p1  ORF type:complete len:135 (+),score=30.09 TRINITY_DN8897_c0_g1_i1:554-958(+)
MNELPALEKLVQDLNSGEPTYGSGVRSSGEAEAELRECKRNITELEERLESALQSADETRLVQLRNVRDATFKELTELTSELDVKTHQLFFTIAPEKTPDLQQPLIDSKCGVLAKGGKGRTLSRFRCAQLEKQR